MEIPQDAILSLDRYSSKMASLLLEMYAEQKVTNEYLVSVAMDFRYPEMSKEERDNKYVEIMSKMADYKAKMKIEFYETLFLEQSEDAPEDSEQKLSS